MIRLRSWPALLCQLIALWVAVGIFYWRPLAAEGSYIQWDAVDVHYSSQKYFADHLRHGELPFWTPYVFSGFPFLADPQIGAWYPLNWPFFAAGITAKSIQVEVVLHALVAGTGALLLATWFSAVPAGALVAGIAYALGGFFVGHSSHVGMVQTAALLPWLLLSFLRAIEARNVFAWTAVAGLVGGCLILVGHFQSALYSVSALGVVAAVMIAQTPSRWRRIAAVAGAVGALSLLVSAVSTLPGLELASRSVRAGMDFRTATAGALEPETLLTLFQPDHYGALSGTYQGPGDITQAYLYMGLLAIPLAVLGCLSRKGWHVAAALTLVAFWYALGPAAGLHALVSRLPGFALIRSPVHAWFVAALGISLLAGLGVSVLSAWLPTPVLLVIPALLFADLWYWNAFPNPIAFSPTGFRERFAKREEVGRQMLASTQPALSRFHAPPNLFSFGTLNHPMELKLEATYGYNPLELRGYADYMTALDSNPKLLAGLNVSRYLDLQRGGVFEYAGLLPRAYFPKSLLHTHDAAGLRQALLALDPARAAVVEQDVAGVTADAAAEVSIVDHGDDRYRIRYQSSSPNILRVAIPYFPGWRATIDGRALDVVTVDGAFLGIVVPPGAGEILLQYRSTYFWPAVAMSVLGVMIVAGAIVVLPAVQATRSTR